MNENAPLAVSGLISYRAKGPYGFIFIGAKDDTDAWRQAFRSSDNPKDMERWNGSEYVPV